MEGPGAGWVPQLGALPLLLSSVWEPDSWAAPLYGPTCRHGAGRLCCRTDQEPKERDELLSPGSFQYKGCYFITYQNRIMAFSSNWK